MVKIRWLLGIQLDFQSIGQWNEWNLREMIWIRLEGGIVWVCRAVRSWRGPMGWISDRSFVVVWSISGWDMRNILSLGIGREGALSGYSSAGLDCLWICTKPDHYSLREFGPLYGSRLSPPWPGFSCDVLRGLGFGWNQGMIINKLHRWMISNSLTIMGAA